MGFPGCFRSGCLEAKAAQLRRLCRTSGFDSLASRQAQWTNSGDLACRRPIPVLAPDGGLRRESVGQSHATVDNRPIRSARASRGYGDSQGNSGATERSGAFRPELACMVAAKLPSGGMARTFRQLGCSTGRLTGDARDAEPAQSSRWPSELPEWLTTRSVQGQPQTR